MRLLNESNWESEIARSPNLVILIFSAPWCGPCKAMEPFLEELDRIYTNVDFFKLNIDECPELAHSQRVGGVPTFKFIKHGEQLRTQVGAINPSQLESQIRSLLDNPKM